MKNIILLMGLLVSFEALATNFTGHIQKMIVGREGHQIYIHMKDAPQTCGKDHPLGFNYAFSLRDNEAGEVIFSALLAAQVAKKAVTIQGQGPCTIDSHMENLGYIYTY